MTVTADSQVVVNSVYQTLHAGHQEHNVCVHLLNASDTLTSILDDVVRSRRETAPLSRRINLDNAVDLVWSNDDDKQPVGGSSM